MTTIGILGAGKLGTVLARLSTSAGYRTLIAGSGDPEALKLVLSVLSPDAVAARASEVAREADVVILALPLGNHHSVPAADLAGKIVIDAMNYWPPTDGVIPEFENSADSSTVVARTLAGARVVKALSHLGYHELYGDARPVGAADRRGIAVAGDDPAAVDEVAAIVDRLGFDPVIVGQLSDGARFGPGTSLFGASVSAAELRDRLDADVDDAAA
jgi:8-hydroxy-5-deazaflavin:NADPH oxidoreductase